MPTIISVSGAAASTGGGAVLASGVLSATQFSGPWSVEEQSLTIDYWRVPRFMLQASGTGELFEGEIFSLSSNNTRTMKVGTTSLVMIIYASYSKKKVYATYSTSSYQQPQKFSIVRDTDHFGIDYGVSAAGLNFAMGPAGRVVTSQKYIRRTGWDDSVDSEVSKNIVVTNTHYVSKGGDIVDYAIIKDPTLYAGKFKHSVYYPGNTVSHSWLYNGEPIAADDSYNFYTINGPYALSKESDSAFINMLNNIGDFINNAPTQIGSTSYYYGTLKKANPVNGVDYLYPMSAGASQFYTANNYITMFPYIAQYSPSRHDYT